MFLYQMFLAFYALVKYKLDVNRGKTPLIKKILLSMITFVVISFLTIFIAICGIFFVGLTVYLRWKEPDNFTGMMYGQDPVWTSLNTHILITINAKEPMEQVMSKMRIVLENLYNSCVKFQYSIRTCLGYRYYVKSHLKLNDFVTYVNHGDYTYWNLESLCRFIETTLLCENVLKGENWKFTIFNNPIEWSNGSKKYAFILTVNHSVADGAGILALLKNKVLDEFQFLNLTTNANANISHATTLDDTYIFSQKSQLDVIKTNKKQNLPLLSLFMENKPKYVSLIKKIKTKLNVGFTDVLLAGFILAFSEYKTKKNMDNSLVKINYTFRPLDVEAMQMIEGNYDYNNIGNNVFIATIDLDTSYCRNMLETARELHRVGRDYINSSNIMLLKIFNEVTYLLPLPLSTAVFENILAGMNVSITNVTDVVSAQSRGYHLENMTFFVSPSVFTNLLVCVLSYGDKLQISVQTGINIVESREDLNGIINRAFEHIESLND